MAAADATSVTYRGGDVRTLLGPMSVGSFSGFMGVATIAPGDRVSEHYHPHSEEFLYVVRGTLTAQLDDESFTVPEGSGLFVPMLRKHRLLNEGEDEVFVVFHLSPLAPRPQMGHVDTE
jgi:putative monooxygenase